MGCCSSRAAATDPTTAYTPNQPHATSATPIAGQSRSPRTSTGSRGSQDRRYLSPAARFNEPLRAHIFVSKTSWTSSKLERERQDFFDTRVSGRPEAWSLIKAATEMLRQGDVETAQTMSNAAGLTVPTGDLVEGVYDGTGAYYQLPDWVVADPVNLQEGSDEESKDVDALKAELDSDTNRKNEKGKGKAPSAEEGVTLKARLSDRATDIVLTVSRSDSIGSIIERIKEESGIIARVRLAYLGRILSESKSLEGSGWKEGHVVNAMVFATS